MSSMSQMGYLMESCLHRLKVTMMSYRLMKERMETILSLTKLASTQVDFHSRTKLAKSPLTRSPNRE